MKSDRAMELARLTAELALIRASRPIIYNGASQIANDAYLLIRHASRLQRYAEVDCNSGLTDKQKSSRDHVCRMAKVIAERYGIKIGFSGDPRGYVTHLHFPSGIYNTMGGKEAGWGI